MAAAIAATVAATIITTAIAATVTGSATRLPSARRARRASLAASRRTSSGRLATAVGPRWRRAASVAIRTFRFSRAGPGISWSRGSGDTDDLAGAAIDHDRNDATAISFTQEDFDHRPAAAVAQCGVEQIGAHGNRGTGGGEDLLERNGHAALAGGARDILIIREGGRDAGKAGEQQNGGRQELHPAATITLTLNQAETFVPRMRRHPAPRQQGMRVKTQTPGMSDNIPGAA